MVDNREYTQSKLNYDESVRAREALEIAAKMPTVHYGWADSRHFDFVTPEIVELLKKRMRSREDPIRP